MSRPATGRRIDIRREVTFGGALPQAPFASRLINANYADREIVLAGSDVSAWGDVVGGRDWVQADTSKDPAYGVFTTKPAIVFDGVNDMMTAPATPAANVWTIAFSAVMQGAGGHCILETSPLASAANPGSLLIYENGGNLLFEYYRTGTTRKNFAQGAQTVRIIAVLDPATSGADCWPRIYRNGALVGAYGIVAATTGQIGSYGWTMGSFNSATFPWGGKMGDCLIYGDALTAGEVATVDAWLAARCV
ncbi:MAG: hypothetical protein KAY59_06965 [Acidobacteria bacterium]|nr:hypothetical protein [Acidobacteriota bacterium]